ncbi:uncharacterized protein [Coffea arabica]|uniref:RING-type E3 ubiquitin transferase n=1 Tax=Coffea arabica TaxID=13443 RepID=A0A6P6XC00_COFAR|nr:RING-H2 finger protein ATL34-like [Coffea arabica]
MEHEADTPSDDFCDAWQADHLEIPKTDQPAPSDDGDDDTQQFFIKFKVELIYPPDITLEDDEDYVLVEFGLESSTSIHQFWAPCKRSDSENLSWDEISTMLTRINVPLHKQPSMLHRISTSANHIANADHNRSKKVLPMMVSISILVDYSCYKQEDASTYVLRNNADVAKLMPVPASNESVEGLKKEILEDQGNVSVKQCMICLENLQAGSEIMGMPCSHLYHQICILHWLKISNFCPICRFQLSA